MENVTAPSEVPAVFASVSQQEQLPRSIRSMVFVRDWGIMVLLLGLVGGFAIWHGTSFFSVDNGWLVLDEAARTFPFAAGVCVGVLGGALDLSVPGVAAFVSVVVGKLLIAGVPIPIALVLGLVLAAMIGLINGLITLRGFNPLVVTIGTLSVLTGAATIVTNSYTIPNLDMLNFMGTDRHFGIPAPVFVAFLLFTLGTAFLTKTRTGIRLLAVGGNAEAVRRLGVNSNRYKLIGFIISAVCAGIGGLLNAAYVTEANPSVSPGIVFTALTAVALAGVSLGGGRGSLPKVFIGVLILAVISDGLVIGLVQPGWTTVATGVLLLGALTLDKGLTMSISRRLVTVGSMSSYGRKA
jgi:ribose transport system permease protein